MLYASLKFSAVLKDCVSVTVSACVFVLKRVIIRTLIQSCCASLIFGCKFLKAHDMILVNVVLFVM
jgi:hypothetical protein